MDKIGIYAVPFVIMFIVVFGAVKKVDLFESFRQGAKDGIGSLISVAPSLIGLVLAVNMLDASGFFDIICSLLSPVCSAVGIPQEVLPHPDLHRPDSGL